MMKNTQQRARVNRRRLIMLISYLVFCLCTLVLAYERPFNVEKVSVKKTVTKKTTTKTVKKTYTAAELRALKYPEELVEFMEKYPETTQFVVDYKKDADTYNNKTISIKSEVKKGTIPLFIQWDKRWGYRDYAGGFFATKTCGPTCMSMVYSGLTGKTDMDPYKMSQWSYSHGYYEQGVGTRWLFMENAAPHFGLVEKDIANDVATIKEYLKAKYVLIANVKKGDFTKSGHYIVITGLTSDGKLKVNDPNSRINSAKTWSITRVSKQIKLLGAFRLKSTT